MSISSLTEPSAHPLASWFTDESRWCRIIPAVDATARPVVWDLEDWDFKLHPSVVAMSVDGAIQAFYRRPLRTRDEVALPQSVYVASDVANREDEVIAMVHEWVMKHNRQLRIQQRMATASGTGRRSDVAMICWWNDRVADFAEVVQCVKELEI